MNVHATNVEEMGVVNAMLCASTHGRFEMRSRAMIGDRPLVHVAFGYDEETGALKVARGSSPWKHSQRLGGLGGIAMGALASAAWPSEALLLEGWLSEYYSLEAWL